MNARTHAAVLARALALALVLIAPSPLAARAQDVSRPPAGEEKALRAGEPAHGSVATSVEEETFAAFRFRVGPDTVAVRLELEAEADLDLYLQEKATEQPRDGAVRSSKETAGAERVSLTRADQRPLRAGSYFAYVVWPVDRHPELPRTAAGAPLAAVPFTLRLTEVKTHIDAVLKPGEPLRDTMLSAGGSFRSFAIDVPAGEKCLRVDLSDSPAQLSMRLRREKPIVDPEDAELTSRAPYATQWILVKPESDPPLQAGRYFVDVVDESQLESSFPFTIRASFKPEPDPSLLMLPRSPAPKNPLEAALQATVEVIGEDGGGSGVILNDRGMILTNFHVVQEQVEGKGQIGAPLVVALLIDPRDPPREAFHARVVTASAELDLALLAITDTLYGTPLPADFRFPTIAVGDPASLGIGDVIFAAGYPGAGGSGSRVSVTVTRGILAGWERRGKTLHIKTDATINSGNSGGAALNDRYEVIGLPTETIPDQDERGRGQIGFIRPLWLVPSDWWQMIGVARHP